MIEVKDLTKKFGDKTAVNQVSFSVDSGEIVGLLGPNGAGKTTVMNIITGYLSATAGSVTVGGFDILERPIDAKKQIGFLPELPPVYNDLTVDEYLKFVFELKKCKLDRKSHIGEILETVKISSVRGRLIGNLSKGYKQRVGLAQAMIGNPSILILDEPTVGLDPKEIIEIRKLIKKIGASRTVLLSSHILSEIQAVCDRIIVINEGNLIADEKTENLTNVAVSENKLELRIAAKSAEALKLIKEISGVIKVTDQFCREANACEFLLDCDKEIDVRKPLFNALAKANMPILMMKPYELSLEDAFIKLVDSTSSQNNTEKDSGTASRGNVSRTGTQRKTTKLVKGRKE